MRKCSGLKGKTCGLFMSSIDADTEEEVKKKILPIVPRTRGENREVDRPPDFVYIRCLYRPLYRSAILPVVHHSIDHHVLTGHVHGNDRHAPPTVRGTIQAIITRCLLVIIHHDVTVSVPLEDHSIETVILHKGVVPHGHHITGTVHDHVLHFTGTVHGLHVGRRNVTGGIHLCYDV